MKGWLLGALLGLGAIAACKEPPRKAPTGLAPSAAIRAPGPVTAEAPVASAPEPKASATARAKPASTAIAAPPLASGDVCRVTRGPVQLPFTGPATLWIDEASPEKEVRVVFNHGGVPRATTLPAASAKPAKSGKREAAKKPERLALSEPAERLGTTACAFAGGQWFCVDKAGAIHRATAIGEEGPVIAQARVLSPIAAAPIGGSHVVYAFLSDRKTTEGATTLAFAALDDGPPQTLSEDGAGATFVTLVPRGEEVVSMYIDARRALTPVHARVITAGAGNKLGFGTDAVIFVGGGSEGRAGGVIAQGAPGSELGLLGMGKDEKDFGLAAIRIEQQPRDDAKTTWSLYPGGLDRAPVAATQGTVPVRVLHVRPASAEPKAKKVLELGELDAAGVYKTSCPVAEGSRFADLAIAVDRRGAVWLAYTDADGTWIERRGR